MDLFAFRKPKNELESDEGESKNVPFVPEEMWIKCPKCNTMLLTTDMEENLHVCTKCNHHFRMNGRDRVEMLADKDTFVEFDADLSSHNILDFPGYDEKLEKARKTGAKESVICGECKMNGIDNLQPTIDKYAPLFYVRKDAAPLILITGDRNIELFGRYEENAYMWRMMNLVGRPDTQLYEIAGHGHGAMGNPAYHILIQSINKILGKKYEF